MRRSAYDRKCCECAVSPRTQFSTNSRYGPASAHTSRCPRIHNHGGEAVGSLGGDLLISAEIACGLLAGHLVRQFHCHDVLA